tara:strand:+ start:231 stop:2297 length:2067 start_codon:yes stop_codon:yes gene_type:complete
MKTILFAGGTSLLAYSWTLKPNQNYNYILATHKRKIKDNKYKTLDLDFSQESMLSRKIEDNDVNIIINCIGLTNVEDCESNIKMADYANIQIAKSLASVCSKKKIKLVHISTDHLFDGTKSYYTENDIKSPLNNYAKTKSQAEDEILALNKDALIIRTNFFGWGPSYKNSFSDKILKFLESDKKIELFEDVFYSPISVEELKNQIFKLIKLNAKGIFNVASNERISKYNFGCQIAKIFGYSEELVFKASINNYKNLTKRPREMSLSNHKLNTFTGGTVPSIEKQLEKLKIERNYDEERPIIPYGRQDISQTDIDSVIKVLKSDFVTQGPVIQQFENKVAEYCNSKYAYACNSGTSALHIACLSLGVKKGDLVWTSPISFVASSNCALYCQADVDFVDIDSQTNNMSPKFLEDKLKLAKKSGRLPKVVIPVHLSGQSCDMKKIHKLSIEYGFKIIEDASHAIGAKYEGHPVGDCRYSDIAVFSFHPVKIITTCEGGMCLTNDPELSVLIYRYRSHGITRQPSQMTKVPDGPWYYEQLELGLNYRMNDVQAALGLSQMSRLEEFVEQRHYIANRYDELLSDSIVETPKVFKDSISSWHLYIIRLKANKNTSHRQLFEKFRTAGILVNIHYIPIYRQPFYKSLGFSKSDYPEAEKYYSEAISIPIFPGLKETEQDKVISLIKKPVGFQNLF